MGRASFPTPKLVENAEAMINEIKRIKPATSKGVYLRKVTMKGTMTPAVEVQVAPVVAAA